MLCVIFVCLIASGCATKVINVEIPEMPSVSTIKGYVVIEEINDLRKFEKDPSDPSSPSIEGGLIDNKELTDKSIGRMRHGIYHKALWNFTIKGDDDIYDICRKIVTSSLASAGYITVEKGQKGYDEALPIAVDVIQFWAWMQPRFNIDLNFDGEMHIRALDDSRDFDVRAKGEHMFSTGFAGGNAWNALVKKGVKDLDENLVLKFKGITN